jgi:hypothetical protein
MTTVNRIVASVPRRSTEETWQLILEFVAPGHASAARRELDAVGGICCCCIADGVLANDALVVYGAGPRVRIYGLYGEDALEGDGVNESALGFVPAEGDWRISIPCRDDDLKWVNRSLRTLSSRVTARSIGETVDDVEKASSMNSNPNMAAKQPDVIDLNAFFRR